MNNPFPVNNHQLMLAISSYELIQTSFTFIFLQGAAIDRILGEIVHRKRITTPIDYVLCIGHFLSKVVNIFNKTNTQI